MSDALLIILGSLAVGNLVYDKVMIHMLRKQATEATAAFLEVAGEKRASATIRTGDPAPAREREHPLQRPQQIGLGRRP